MKLISEIYYKSFRLFYKILGANLSKNVQLYGSIKIIGSFNNLYIGNDSTINYGTLFNCRDIIKIGEKVRISPYVQFHTGALNIDPKNRIHYQKKIIVKDNVWISSGCIINPGVIIGENSVLLPGSVLNENMKPNSIYGGVPAKLIKTIYLNE